MSFQKLEILGSLEIEEHLSLHDIECRIQMKNSELLRGIAPVVLIQLCPLNDDGSVYDEERKIFQEKYLNVLISKNGNALS